MSLLLLMTSGLSSAFLDNFITWFGARRGLEVISSGRTWHESYWTKLFDATQEGRINTWEPGLKLGLPG